MKIRKRLHISVMLALGTVLFITNCELANNPPNISITVENYDPLTGSTQTLSAVVQDPDENDVVRVSWSVRGAGGGGVLANTSGEEVKWTAPLALGEVVVTAIADDGISNGIDSAHARLNVVNATPEITSFEVTGFANKPPYVLMGGTIELECVAVEPDDEQLSYSFNTQVADAGSFQHASPEDNTALWIAPEETELAFSRTYKLFVVVSDEQGYFSSDTLDVLVYKEAGTIWVVDSEQAIVSKYTDLGDYILTSSHAFKEPRAVTNDVTQDYGCYVADYAAGEVVKLDPEGEMEYIFANAPNVVDLAIHGKTLWVLSEADSALLIYNTWASGEPVYRVSGFKQPRAIAINQNNHSVWISDVGDNSVIQLSALDLDTLPDSASDPGVTVFRDQGGNAIFNYPSGLGTRRQSDATIYIADQYHNQIERLTYSSGTGTYSRNTPVSIENPSQVVSNVKGEVWVLNSEGSIQYFLESDINIAPFPVLSYDFSNPNSMAVDGVTGEVWIGDNGNHQVVKVLSPDSLAVVISGVDFVAGIVVNR